MCSMGKAAKQPNLKAVVDEGLITVVVPEWEGMRLGPARCRITLSGKERKGRATEVRKSGPGTLEVLWETQPGGAQVKQTIIRETPQRLRCRSILTNIGRKSFTLDQIELWSIDGIRGSRFDLGTDLAQVRVLENRAYHGQARSVGQIMTGIDQRKSLDGVHGAFYSEAATVLYSHSDGLGLLIGFETFERFNGRTRAGSRRVQGRLSSVLDNTDRGTFGPKQVFPPSPKLGPSDRFTEASIGFAGANLPVEPGQSITLEEFVMEVGPDPFRLLEAYADRVAERYGITDTIKPFANWCSWYPYRLGLTEDRMQETARVAKSRHLDRLGLRFIQADLGWEQYNIPTYFEENDRFPHGLKWLAGKLAATGFKLGVWKGFTCVSENHPMAREHPDWLVRDESGRPKAGGTWFWEPHDRMFALDVTHPGAQEWIRTNIESLAERGVRYLKWDFGGNIIMAGQRYDPHIACSGALEGMRMTGRIVQDAMISQGEEGFVLDCTACETANIGTFRMFYTTYDTGNTGIGFNHLRHVYTTVAAHLFKNHRWGLLQPSCLVVGLPGTLEEARVRATVTFMTGGHIDISEDLTRLPEDRWQVLLSVLPPIDKAARVIDLFHPVSVSSGSYTALCKGEESQTLTISEPQGATVWHLPVRADWDRWDLVAILHLFESETESGGSQLPIRFQVDFEHLGLDPRRRYWAHEFWAGQFLGSMPVPAWPREAYRHPGDSTGLVNDSQPGVLDVLFHGPAVKLLVIRRPRRHPWPVATTFHQSGGMELADVKWDSSSRTLSGTLHRPPGETGAIIVAGVRSNRDVKVTVDGRRTPGRSSANGSLAIPVVTQEWVTSWSVEV